MDADVSPLAEQEVPTPRPFPLAKRPPNHARPLRREGPTLLLLRGFPGRRGTFAQIGARLGQWFRAFEPDLLRFRESDDAPSNAHAAQHADVSASMAASFELERFHLFGFDFGGPTAVELTGKFRRKIQSLTLIPTKGCGGHASKYRAPVRVMSDSEAFTGSGPARTRR